MKSSFPFLPLERRTLWWVLLVTFLIKVWLAMAIPITSDEAYFVQWARHLDYRPIVDGSLHDLGNALFWLRLGAIFATALIGAGIYWLLREYGEQRALGSALVFLLSPIHFLMVFVAAGIPLAFFSFFSAACLFRAIREERMGWYALSGLCLGAAFLSGYSALLLGLGYFVYWLVEPKPRRRNAGLLLLFLLVLPFVGVNLAWGGWANIMNHHKGATFSLGRLAVFLVGQAYLLTPFLLWRLWKGRAKFQVLALDRRFSLFAYTFLIPLGGFALLSLKGLGLPWVLSFYPCYFVLLALLLNRDQLGSAVRAMAWYSGVQLLLLGILLRLFPGKLGLWLV